MAYYSELPYQKSTIITGANIQEKDLSMESWTAPGPDICQNFAAHWNWLLMEGDRLGVIYWRKVSPDPTKYRQRGNDAHLTADKLHSRIIAVRISGHMAQYLSLGQKGISKHTRLDQLDQLLVDRAVIQAKWTNVYNASIDIEDSPWQIASHMDSGEL